MNGADNRLTVIVCTYNRSEMLRYCLESLTTQSASSEHFAVVVVDNNSTDNTTAVAESFSPKIVDLKVIFEPQQGLSYARNRGMGEAETEWVVFLDDDAIANSDWVEQIYATIDRDDFDVFGGVYTAWHHFGPPPIWFGADMGTNAAVQKEYGILERGFPSGGNCACKKSLLLAHGGFPTHLGMKGNAIRYGEETSLFSGLREQGVRIGFVPAMRIAHCVLPYKYRMRWQLMSAFANGRDYYLLWYEKASFNDVARSVRQLGVGLIRVGKCCLIPKLKNGKWQRGFLDAGKMCAGYVGQLVGIVIKCAQKN